MEETIKSKQTQEHNNEFFAKTGISGIDSIMGTMTSGDLVVIGGEDGVGKTTLASQIALHVSKAFGFPVEIFTNEMMETALFRRLFPAALRYAEGDRDNEAYRQYELLNEADVLLSSFSGIDIYELSALIYKAIKEKGVKLVVVDSLQAINGSKAYLGNRAWEIDQIVRDLKSIAMAQNIIVVLVSHMNRSAGLAGSYPDRMSGLRNLKDSSAIGHLADEVLIPEFCDSYDACEDTPEHQHQRIRVAKARHGLTGSCDVIFSCSVKNGPHFFEEEIRSSIFNGVESAMNQL